MNRTLTTAIAALGMLAMTAGSAFAVSAVATADVNMRSGAGIEYAKIGVLKKGTAVNVTECKNNFCYVEKTGTDGWVSSKYLAEGAPDDLADSSPDVPVHFGVTVGPGGPSISFGIGDAPLPPPVPVTPKVCFYKNNNFGGARFCATPGTNNNHLAGGWNDSISSIEIAGGAGVTVCRNWWYGGGCVSYNSSKPFLGPAWNNAISSFQVY